MNINGNDLPGVNFITDVVKLKKQIQVRLNYGCGETETILLSPRLSAPAVSSSVEGIPPTCYGGQDGSFTLTFDRNLYAGETLELGARKRNDTTKIINVQVVITNNKFTLPKRLPAGTYDIVLIGKYPDASYATYTGQPNDTLRRTVTIPERSVVTFGLTKTKDVNCYGGSDGTMSITASGGVGPYRAEYLLNGTPTTTPTFTGTYLVSGLPKGTYLVKVKDSNGCYAVNTTTMEVIERIVTITEPTIRVAVQTLEAPKNLTGYNTGNGEIKLIASGGTAGYTYNWSKAGQALSPNPAATGTNLSAGAYFITVQDSKYSQTSPATDINRRGCMDTITVSLTQPDLLVVNIAEKLPISCNGQSDGRLVARAIGGVKGSGYTYAWTKLVGSTWTPQPGTDSLLSNLPIGKYKVTVKDVNNNTAVSSEFTLGQPAVLTISGFNQKQPDCNGNANAWAEPLIVGGTQPYSYLWYEPGMPTSHRLTGLTAGTYTVAVTDARGCGTSNGDVEIGEPDELSAIATITLPTAHYASNGSISLQVMGGTLPYGYTWTYNNATQNPLTGLPANDLPYAVTITDAKGCTVNLQPRIIYQLSVQLQVHDSISCFGQSDGRLFAQATGGVGTTYRYRWYHIENGVPQALPVGDDTNPLLASTPAGTYRVMVADMENNEAWSTDLVFNQPDVLNVTHTVTMPSAYNMADGAITLHPIGSTTPYTYAWVYNNSTTNPLSNLAAQDDPYTVTVTDRRGCTKTIAPRLIYPINVSLSLLDSISCAGRTDGRLTAQATGGVGSVYKYEWYKVQNGTPHKLPVHDSTSILQNVGVGTYRVKATDREFNIDSVDLIFNEPDTLEVAFTTTLPSALHMTDGAIALHPTGGTIPYSYAWVYNNATTSSLSNLAARDDAYTVTVTDRRGCTKTIAPRLIYPIHVSLSLLDSISCAGRTDGRLVARATGGVGTVYKYEWYKVQNGVPSKLTVHDSTSILQNVGAGTYRVKATDREFNSFTAPDFLFNEPDTLKVSISQRNLKCKFDTDAWVAALPSGGTTPYTYSWSNTATGHRIEQLAETSYSVRVTDRRNCVVDAQTTILSPDELQLSIQHLPPRGFDYTDASVWVHAIGGTGTYSYAWQNRTETTDSLSSIGHGVYTALVTDVNGCSKQITDTVPNPPLLEVFVFETQVISCRGRSDGEISTVSVGGVGDHRYTWYRVVNGSLDSLGIGDVLGAIPAGTYRVKVTDRNKVTAYSADFILIQPDLLEVTVRANSIACNGDRNGWVEASSAGGTLPHSYLWTTGDRTTRVENLTDNKYFVFVTDARGCETKGQGEITVPGGLVVDTLIQRPTCHNDRNGSIQLVVDGGARPYTYAWANGDTSPLLYNLVAGNYRVVVTDANGCFRDITYTLDNPAPISIDLGPDKTLCKGQQLELNVATTDPLAQYRWYKDTKLYSSQPSVQLTEPAIYRVELTNGKGCKGEGMIRIKQSNEEISANFAMATKAPRGEAVRLVNASHPAPERTEWLIPDDPNIAVLLRDDSHAELVFNRNGIYMLGIRSGQDECEQSIYKTIEITDKINLPELETPKEPFLKQFITFPNPSNGQFTVRIELSEKADLRLRLISLSGTLVEERKVTGSDYYEVQYNLNSTPKGMYILQLLSEKANTSVKLVFY